MEQVRPSTGTADQKESIQLTYREGAMVGSEHIKLVQRILRMEDGLKQSDSAKQLSCLQKNLIN